MLCRNGGHEHSHETVYQSKVCHGLITPPVAPTHYARSVEPKATKRQVEYAIDLGGVREVVARMTVKEASSYIDGLKSGNKESRVTEYQQPRTTLPPDPRETMLAGMLTAIAQGYYAVPLNDSDDHSFVRISFPKNGKYKGCTKIQTIHGENLKERAILYPSGTFSIFAPPRTQQRDVLLTALMGIVSDSHACNRRYAQIIGRCCRCNKQLTDTRSRHYGIGPECEEYMPWVIDEVDAESAA
jgi:hypothetical protein